MTKRPSPTTDTLEALREFYRRVDLEAKALAKKHTDRLQCGAGCADCCLDDLSVLPVEADLIREHDSRLLRESRPHPTGACAFLDDQRRCRIYDRRPYICRTQGLPLRWFGAPAEDDGVGEIEEFRDICPLNAPGPAIEKLADDDCWLLGPFEAELEELANAHAPRASTERIRLRDLFETD